MRGTWCQYGANLRKNEKMVRCVPVVPAGVQKGRYDLIWHQKAKRKNAAIPWLNSDKEVNLISTVSQWISVCLLEIRLISNRDMDGLLYGAYYGQASL